MCRRMRTHPGQRLHGLCCALLCRLRASVRQLHRPPHLCLGVNSALPSLHGVCAHKGVAWGAGKSSAAWHGGGGLGACTTMAIMVC